MMLRNCANCGQIVLESSIRCPYCKTDNVTFGKFRPQPMPSNSNRLLILLGVWMFVFPALFFLIPLLLRTLF